MLLDKLNIIKERFDEVSKLIIEPEIISDQKKYIKLNREYKELNLIMVKRDEYLALLSNKKEAQEIISEEKDLEMLAMAKEELENAILKLEGLEEEIRLMLIPKDPDDAKNVVMEFRAGTGGDEASIFAGDLFRLYTKFCDQKGWKTSVVDMSEGTSGGFKEIIIDISGENVYGTLKYESGVHRVQRVPETETQGRVHTSAATVMVLPEAEDVDIQLDMSEIRIERTTSTGPGGQSVNTTYSAIKLHHEPTGMIISCQDQKSSHKNLEKAMKVLRSRLYDMEMEKKLASDSEKRKSMVSSGDRSAKIRTYNYPQGRVTDHRIGLTLYDLNKIMDGDIQKFIDEIQLHENTEKLKQSES